MMRSSRDWKYDGGIMTPDKFLPLIAQFNLSARFGFASAGILVEVAGNTPLATKKKDRAFQSI